jgi:hypothetical protein
MMMMMMTMTHLLHSSSYLTTRMNTRRKTLAPMKPMLSAKAALIQRQSKGRPSSRQMCRTAITVMQ